ncbi:MAG: hypothetical protein ACRD1J_06065 [Terriglobia bacterium]
MNYVILPGRPITAASSSASCKKTVPAPVFPPLSATASINAFLPAAHTYQSDVETVHHLIEDAFYNLETLTSRAEFLAKAAL